MKNRRTMAYALGALILLLYLYRMRGAVLGIAAVFAFAGVFTLLLAPLCARLEKRGLSASSAAALSVAALVLGIVLLLASFVPYLITHCVDLIRSVTPTLSGLLAKAGNLLARFGLSAVQGGSGSTSAS